MSLLQAQKAFSASYGIGYASSLDSLVQNSRLPVEVAKGRFAAVPAMNATASGFQVRHLQFDGVHESGSSQLGCTW